jgi:hypothetical protein
MRLPALFCVLALGAQVVALGSSSAEPPSTATTIEKLKLALDFPGSLEIHDTDVTGKDKLPATEVRIETSIKEIGTVHVEIVRDYQTADDAKRVVAHKGSDTTNVAITKLPERGWILTWQYNKDRWYGVKVLKKLKGKWVLMDARPESREASDVILAAFKSMRSST